jgi:nitroimidazol reductase NimA-like FMN-containing flavoprotein (pyridoxamine 5'-phosphate oxidase superfamily)
MIGKSTDDQIIHVLYGQRIGRIACQDEGRLYIVPVSYAFDRGYIYCHSMDGLKTKMMRNNPSVCFQVDDIDNMTNWRSVIAWGKL